LFQGTNFTEIFAATTPLEFVQAVTVTYQNVPATQPAERMKAVAREIARSGPDILGLQEVAILRTGAAAPATTVAADMLAILLQELANLGHHYLAVAILPGVDAEAPSTLGFDVRLTSQDVIITRADRWRPPLRLSNLQIRDYQAQLILHPAVGPPVTNRGGWASVDVGLPGQALRFVTTHLAFSTGFAPTVSLPQAKELLATAGHTKLPVILVGDSNSVASDPTDPSFVVYQSLIDAGFTDTWHKLHPNEPGYSCCQPDDLHNPISALSFRVDLVLTRGDLGAEAVSQVGNTPADRTPSGLWPSDHAGLVATIVPHGNH
jgi:endonuclease/exonuclease/phosphatase family metal-dependent hydrolase